MPELIKESNDTHFPFVQIAQMENIETRTYLTLNFPKYA